MVLAVNAAAAPSPPSDADRSVFGSEFRWGMLLGVGSLFLPRPESIPALAGCAAGVLGVAMALRLRRLRGRPTPSDPFVGPAWVSYLDTLRYGLGVTVAACIFVVMFTFLLKPETQKDNDPSSPAPVSAEVAVTPEGDVGTGSGSTSKTVPSSALAATHDREAALEATRLLAEKRGWRLGLTGLAVSAVLACFLKPKTVAVKGEGEVKG